MARRFLTGKKLSLSTLSSPKISLSSPGRTITRNLFSSPYPNRFNTCQDWENNGEKYWNFRINKNATFWFCTFGVFPAGFLTKNYLLNRESMTRWNAKLDMIESNCEENLKMVIKYRKMVDKCKDTMDSKELKDVDEFWKNVRENVKVMKEILLDLEEDLRTWPVYRLPGPDKALATISRVKRLFRCWLK